MQIHNFKLQCSLSFTEKPAEDDKNVQLKYLVTRNVMAEH